MLVTREPAEAAWPVRVETATALPVFMAFAMDCPPGEAKAAVAKKIAELVRVNFIVDI